jgi:hypothetical protein
LANLIGIDKMPASARLMPTFLDSLTNNNFARRDRRRIVKTVGQFTNNPKLPGLSFERLRKPKDPNFWSIRVTSGIRIIIYREGVLNTICYVGSHDEAYRWAENKTVGFHTENAIQLIEREDGPQLESASDNDKVEYDKAPSDDQSGRAPIEITKNFVFRQYSDEQLVSFGVPELCLTDIRNIATEDDLMDYWVSMGLEDEIFDNILPAFKGVELTALPEVTKSEEQIAEPMLGRRTLFPVTEIVDNEAIMSAIQQPWNKWLVFLDPAQSACVRQKYSGPAKIYGSAGTGKTVVALHRTAYLAQQSEITENRILFLTFSKTLATDLKEKFELLVGENTKARSRVKILDFESFALAKYSEFNPDLAARIAEDVLLRNAAKQAVRDLKLGAEFSEDFLFHEYMTVIGPWGLQTLDDYLGFQRQGSGKQMGPSVRKRLWPAVKYMRNFTESKSRITRFDLFHRVSEHLETIEPKPADHIIVDECQDIGPEILRMIRAMVSKRDNDIFLCGDSGQSLYRRHHSWLRHGIDIRGRSSVLRVNYRTSRQIKNTADRLTILLASGADGIGEDRRAISTFNGPDPVIQLYEDEDSESAGLAEWLIRQTKEGIKPHQLVIISRMPNCYRRAEKATELAGLRLWQLDDEYNWHEGLVGFSSTERSKGLEYKGVAVIACDADVMPLARIIDSAPDSEEKKELMEIEKNQLYVAMTRARDSLYISGLQPGSIFLKELASG